MLNRGELSTMPPILKYEKYPLKVIRPLCYATEDTIIEHAKDASYISSTCTCTYQDNSERKAARSKLESLTDGSKIKKERIYSALHNVLTDYLP